ncbi:diacylglycerol kinase theta isoform X2 [Anopheles arabiensis]|uniref:diacylglycerol kinase theta isoform X2 n=1 Tax=Anopheles arabiensis TaxID=7173 RepID=UPI001AACA756|nr:diacylglycerol kinase theta isoform X2 [Anopheles arabiensis]
MAGGEHTFGRKTFHKPTYCHHCSDLLWGLIGQGYICEVCNFIVHEKCVTNIVTPCTGVAPYLIRNPVAHCWSEPSHHKRKFCSVCRKRLDETPAVHCLICEHFAHVECQDFAIPDCKENATYVPGKELGHVKHQHHWREGNLPQSSKCAYCKKTCWSYECLTGYRCEWCGTTTHGGCRNNISAECTFGTLQPIYLPPHAVSIPRTEVPMEAIIGVQNRNKGTPGLQRDYSCPELWTIGMHQEEQHQQQKHQQQQQQQQEQIEYCSESTELLLHSVRQEERQHHGRTAPLSPVSFTFYDDDDSVSSAIGSIPALERSDQQQKQKPDDQQQQCHQQQQHQHQQYHSDNSLLLQTDDDWPMRPTRSRNLIHPALRRTKAATAGPPTDTLVTRSRSFQDQTNSIPKRFVKSAACYSPRFLARFRKKHQAPRRSPSPLDARRAGFNGGELAKLLLVHAGTTTNSSSSTSEPTTMAPIRTALAPVLVHTPSGSLTSSSACASGPPLLLTVCGMNGEVDDAAGTVERSHSFDCTTAAAAATPTVGRHFGHHLTVASANELLLTCVEPRRVVSYDDVSGFSFIDDDNEGGSEPNGSTTASAVGAALVGCTNEPTTTSVSPTGSADSDTQRQRHRAATVGRAEQQGALSHSPTQHLLGRIYRQMRKCSMGWSKTGCRVRRARSISEEITTENRYRDDEYVPRGESSGSGTHSKPDSAHKPDKDKDKKDKDKEERDEETIKVFDGNCSYRRRIFRAINVPRTCSLEQLLTTALRAFHIARDPNLFFLTDVYGDEVRLQDPTPVPGLHRVEGKRPAIYLRFRDKENDHGFVRVYPGKLQVENAYVIIPVDNDTTVKDLICESLKKFGLQSHQIEDYRCSEILLDRGVTERVLSWNERPWEIMKQLGKDSIRQMELMRFYLQLKQDPHGPNLALFVGNLPPGLSQRNYEHILTEFLGFENKFSSIGPIYYEYGSLVITYENASKAVRAFQALRESKYEEKHLLVLLLPNIEPSMVPAGVQPLLVFVNVKSGGCQGLELISSFRKLLNPYQVFDLDNGGPLPGLYVFRHIQDYKILVCGGDGTIGWVLQCLDNVGQDSECSSPPCAIVPLGTGNDLARVLRWGAGYTGGEDPLNLLRDVIDAEEIRLDRWTVVFHPEDKPEDATPKAQPNSTVVGGAQSEDNSQIFVMNNYFGIGIDADLCLDFHNAREENPNKFNSRLHNKGVYVKMGLRKMVGRKMVKELHKELRLEVDGKVVELPPVEGIIILNILSWGSGANPWGPEKEDQFSKPNHWDGMLEVVGVTGVVHLGQIQSGLRSAMRIAQGGHIKIHLHSDIPVQVDGEPWVQSPGDVVVLKSALKATMLKKMKGKMKRRNTEPTMQVMGPSGIQMTLAAPQEPDEVDSNNTDF